MARACQDLPRAAIPGATTAATIMVCVGSTLGAALFAVVLQILIRHEVPVPAGSTGTARDPALTPR